MEWTTIATHAGTLFGAGVAAYAAARQSVRSQLKAPTEGIEAMRMQLAALEKWRDAAVEELQKLRDQMSHQVTDEEFSAYTHHTTQAINKLTEKVGHAAGAIEAWYQTRGTRSP